MTGTVSAVVSTSPSMRCKSVTSQDLRSVIVATKSALRRVVVIFIDQQIAGLAVQRLANALQGLEANTLYLARFQKRHVLLGDADDFRELLSAHFPSSATIAPPALRPSATNSATTSIASPELGKKKSGRDRGHAVGSTFYGPALPVALDATLTLAGVRASKSVAFRPLRGPALTH